MEFGNLDLNNLVEKAFILFGNTKAGKTTSMHYFKRS